MLKKVTVFILAASMATAMIGCGCGTTKDKNEMVENTPPETTFESTEENRVESTADQENSTQEGTEIDSTAGETIGKVLLQEFHGKKQENPAITAQEMADYILSLEMIQFEGASMPVEEGLLTGFNNAEIKGFKEGVMFAPMIGSIPFVGYVFTLQEDIDPAAFVQLLKENADPRWNICTEAEETVVESAEDMVFFVMCPTQFE